jgi:beta-lactamase class C
MGGTTETLQQIVDRHFGGLIAPSLQQAEPGKVPGILVGVATTTGPYYFQLGDVPMNQNNPAPAIEDIVMCIASNTKVFTATLLALATLQPTGIAVTLDTAASSLVPNGTILKLYENEAIELWHLATHSAGYPHGLCGKGVFGDYTFTEMASFLSLFTPQYAPGIAYNYSDQAFALLGALLSHAYIGSSTNTSTTWDLTYQDWAKLVTKYITRPLGMSSTSIDYSGVLLNVAKPFLYDEKSKSYTPTNLPDYEAGSAGLGAGALSSTLHDLLVFLMNQIAPPSTTLGKALALTQQEQGNGLAMGLGWAIGNQDKDGNGAVYYFKNGLIPGFASYMAFDPKNAVGVVAMANSWSDDKGEAVCRAGRELLAELRGVPATPGKYTPGSPVPACPNDC